MAKQGELITASNRNLRSVSHYEVEIGKSWHKTVEGVLETATLVREAQETLSTQDWNDLSTRLPFGDSVRSMMLSIGRTNRFGSQRIQARLPGNYNTIYEYSQLGNDEWRMAITEGIVDTDVSTSEVKRWKQYIRLTPQGQATKGLGKTPKTTSSISSEYYAVIPVIDDLSKQKQNKVRKLLDETQVKLKHLGSNLVYQEETTDTFRKSVLTERREKLAIELSQLLKDKLSEYNKHLSFQDQQEIENVYYQYRYYQDHGRYPYVLTNKTPTPSDIRHPDNKYGDNKMGFRGFMKWVRQNKVITQWSPIREWSDLGEEKCIKLALDHTRSKNTNQRSNYKRQLRNIANRNSKNSKYAKKYLAMLIDG